MTRVSGMIALVVLFGASLVDSSSCRKLQLLETIASSASVVSGSSDAVVDYQPGYFVKTAFDGYKLNASIYSTVSVPFENYVYSIDSRASQLLKVHVGIDQSSSKAAAEVVAGAHGGNRGYVDGWVGVALFDRPKGLAVDDHGNIYVADVRNRVIRRISTAGYVSTIAGQANKTGNVDGEGQQALFSGDFDITYFSGTCSLLVSDRGNRKLRIIELLSPQECKPKSSDSCSGQIMKVMGALFAIIVSIMLVALGMLQYQNWELKQTLAAALPLEGDDEVNAKLIRLLRSGLFGGSVTGLKRGGSLPDLSSIADLIDLSDRDWEHSRQNQDPLPRKHSAYDFSKAVVIDAAGTRLPRIARNDASDSPFSVSLREAVMGNMPNAERDDVPDSPPSFGLQFEDAVVVPVYTAGPEDAPDSTPGLTLSVDDLFSDSRSTCPSGNSVADSQNSGQERVFSIDELMEKYRQEFTADWKQQGK